MSVKLHGNAFARWAMFIACICAFAVLMGLRPEASSMWVRAGIAGAAFAILAVGTALFWHWKRRNN